jgi:hypothetical protein
MTLYHSNNAVSTAKVIYCCVGQQVTLNDAERKKWAEEVVTDVQSRNDSKRI